MPYKSPEDTSNLRVDTLGTPTGHTSLLTPWDIPDVLLDPRCPPHVPIDPLHIPFDPLGPPEVPLESLGSF